MSIISSQYSKINWKILQCYFVLNYLSYLANQRHQYQFVVRNVSFHYNYYNNVIQGVTIEKQVFAPLEVDKEVDEEVHKVANELTKEINKEFINDWWDG